MLGQELVDAKDAVEDIRLRLRIPDIRRTVRLGLLGKS
jgi:hypothetical protein